MPGEGHCTRCLLTRSIICLRIVIACDMRIVVCDTGYSSARWREACFFNTGPATVRWLSIQNTPLLVSLSVFSSIGCAVCHTLGTNCRNGHFGGRSANLQFENDLLPHMALSHKQLLFKGTLRDSAGIGVTSAGSRPTWSDGECMYV